MKKFLLRILLLLITVFAVFAFLFGYIRLDSSQIAVVKAKDTGEVLRVFTENHAFSFQGMLPWMYRIKVIKTDLVDDFSVNVVIPGLENVRSFMNSIKIPVVIRYKLDKNAFSAYGLLSNSEKPLKKHVRRIVERSLTRTVHPYLNPVYRGFQLEKDQEELWVDSEKSLMEKLKKDHIVVHDFSVAGPVLIPKNAEYFRGLKYSAELREIEFENRKEIEKLKSVLKQQKLKENVLYEKYRQMAAIIEANPDILKYIYIDKIADDLKVIISSDKSGVPLFLDSAKTEKSVNKTGEIDNLR